LIDPFGLCSQKKSTSLNIFGFGQDPDEFRVARAQTRQFIEMLDVATQGLAHVTVAFDVGGALATQVDIYEANAPLLNKVEATAWNAFGVLGIVGAIPTPKTISLGAAIDAAVFFRINNLLQP
jgi:hypothetical protein